MKKNHKQKKEVLEIKEKALRIAFKELKEVSEKREEDLKEMDRIAKMLIRRDLKLTESEEKRRKELLEMDRTAKMLIRRDFELVKTREKREAEFKELKKSREALRKILKEVDRARARAEEEKNKTLAIIANFVDGLLVFNKENNLALINPRAEDFLGVKKKKIIGKPISKLSRIAALKPLIKLFFKKKEKFFRQEFKISENLILEMSIVPVIRENKGLGTLVILHDITREKLIDIMKSEFVSLTAHQLRTPLSAMKWTMKMILDGELGKINKEQREFLTDSYDSNERMIYLINDLLNIARIEEGKFLYELTLVDLLEMVQMIITSFREKARERKIKIEFKKPTKAIPKLMLDSKKIKMAIENLLDNAIRYNLSGGKVIISLDMVGNEVRFSIKDSGVGIPKSQQRRLFTKFFRAINVMKMDTRGSGLGLYIVKNIIETHKGKIWFESKLNKGTTFYFTLPIKPC